MDGASRSSIRIAKAQRILRGRQAWIIPLFNADRRRFLRRCHRVSSQMWINRIPETDCCRTRVQRLPSDDHSIGIGAAIVTERAVAQLGAETVIRRICGRQHFIRASISAQTLLKLRRRTGSIFVGVEAARPDRYWNRPAYTNQAPVPRPK